MWDKWYRKLNWYGKKIEIDKYAKQNPPKVVILSLIKRYDQDFNDVIATVTEKIQRYCNGNVLLFVENNDMGRSCRVSLI